MEREDIKKLIEELVLRVETGRIKSLDLIPRAAEAIEFLSVNPTPVLYQSRMCPAWEMGRWTDWQICSEGTYNDCTLVPLNADWFFEARKLYDTSLNSSSKMKLDEARFALKQAKYELKRLNAFGSINVIVDDALLKLGE